MKDRIDRLDSHIKFEFELTAQRVTYLTIAESFLFGSYAAAVAVLKKDPAQALDYSLPLNNLIHAVPWIGVVRAGVVFAAVLCAISMIFKLKAVREGLEGSYPGVHRDIGWKSLWIVELGGQRCRNLPECLRRTNPLRGDGGDDGRLPQG